MLLNSILFLVGVSLIIMGANWLTDGSASLAQRFGISPLVVGLTVVAFGTSAPELVVSVTSALHGLSDMSIANVIGSNIFNVLAIGGITALFYPLPVERRTRTYDIPFLILSFFLLLFLSADVLDGLNGQTNGIGRMDGLILLMFFIAYMLYTFKDIRHVDQGQEKDRPKEEKRRKPLWLLLLLIVAGLAGLIGGGQLFVHAAAEIARTFGISEALIGLTLVAGGTSLPELATSLVAAKKGQAAIAMGNVVGSSIFNVLFVLGTAATIQPMAIVGVSKLDFFVMALSSVLLWIVVSFNGNRVIKRSEGILLASLFVAYLALRIGNISIEPYLDRLGNYLL